MRALLILAMATAIAVTAPSAGAQVIDRPADAPSTTAEHADWYVAREPIFFAGDDYFLAGARVFFNGNTMVRTGQFRGVPLYADTTVEPYSLVFVPVGRGLMQPYERLRRGEIAGTTGSRAPSFTVAVLPDREREILAPMAPTNVPLPLAAVDASAAMPMAEPTGPTAEATASTAMAPYTPVPSGPPPAPVNEHVWVIFRGQRWVSAGMALPQAAGRFNQVGEVSGFPVFSRDGEAGVIYLPSRANHVAPYRLKE